MAIHTENSILQLVHCEDMRRVRKRKTLAQVKAPCHKSMAKPGLLLQVIPVDVLCPYSQG